MSSTKRRSARLLPAAGAATVAATAVTGWAPVIGASAATAAPAAPEFASAALGTSAIDGTYESCAAYFGFGKDMSTALDVVGFDVTDENGSDGVDHGVPEDTDIVLVLTNDEGDTLECLPEEISEEAWDYEMAYLADLFVNVELPAWPGPGRYAYPTVEAEPYVEDFGRIVDVGFRVAGTPDGHTLVSPTGVVQLTQHHSIPPWSYTSTIPDARVSDLIEAEAGTQAADDFRNALAQCREGAETAPTAPTAGIEVLAELLDVSPELFDDDVCWAISRLNPEAAYVLAVRATAAYKEPIVLRVPEQATTTTSPTTTTVPSATPSAPGAAPIAGVANYTG